jgi:hypothetical protein
LWQGADAEGRRTKERTGVTMKLMTSGDYYVWECELCGSRNLTIWTKVAKNQLCCAACQKSYVAFEEISRHWGCLGNDSMLPP